MLADYHIHCRASEDSETPPEAQVQAALDGGLDAICFTDHVDLINDYCVPFPDTWDWSEIRTIHREMSDRFGGRIDLAMGVELGEAVLDFAKADRYLDGIPEIDFIIASHHMISTRLGGWGLCVWDFPREKLDMMLSDYFDDMLAIARWGRYSVLGHLTMPDRYMQKKFHLPPLDTGRYWDQIETIWKCVVETGRGLECNTSRGQGPWLPDRGILCRYRELGGEIITLGSDAHTPEFVGAGIREGQELLRECGFRYLCTFRELKPIFHKL